MVVLGKVLARGQVTLPREIRRETGLSQGDIVVFQATSPDTIEIRRLPRLTLAEALERYRIEGPVNDAIDREQWQDVAARDVLGSGDEHGTA